jgi:hypothetical protein
MTNGRLVLLGLLVAACDEAAISSVPLNDDVPFGDTRVGDLSAPLFSRDAVLEVELTLAAADWNALRYQTRDFADILGPNCLDERADPFTYFPADVVIGGRAMSNIGARKKGFLGSLSDTKPSLKLAFDEYTGSQAFLGLKKMTLNNAQQDPSYVKQCVGYDVFRAAGIPAPRCAFAHVSVNGNDLGLYVHVESMNKQFLSRHFKDNDGTMYEGALSDFRAEWVGTFEKKTNESDLDRSDLDAVVAALEVDDPSLVAALDPLVDLDGFYTFWATEVLIGHWDGYAGNTNNFYIYDDPTTGKMAFLPWGVDGILFEDPNSSAPSSVLATGALAWRLYRYGPSKLDYIARMREVVAGAWDADAILASIDAMEELITPVVDPGAGLAPAVDLVRDFVADRAGVITAELDAGAPAWLQPLRAPPCFETIGSVDVAFDTTWGTVGQNPFTAGTGTWDVMLNDAAWGAPPIGSLSGFDENDPTHGVVGMVALLGDGHVGIIYVVINDAALLTPGTVNLDLVNAFGMVMNYDPSTDTSEFVGFLFDGAVVFDLIGTTHGDAVTGTIVSTISTSGLF